MKIDIQAMRSDDAFFAERLLEYLSKHAGHEVTLVLPTDRPMIYCRACETTIGHEDVIVSVAITS